MSTPYTLKPAITKTVVQVLEQAKITVTLTPRQAFLVYHLIGNVAHEGLTAQSLYQTLGRALDQLDAGEYTSTHKSPLSFEYAVQGSLERHKAGNCTVLVQPHHGPDPITGLRSDQQEN